MSSSFSVTPEFVPSFASINDLPQVSDVANMGFDIFAMFWFGYLANIMDTKLQDFANKMTFIANVQQALSNVSTTFEKIKQWGSFQSKNMNTVDVQDLSKAFYSLIRYRAVLEQSYLTVDGNPYGDIMVYSTAKTIGIGRWAVTTSGQKINSPSGVPNPLKDTSLADKITQLLTDLQNSNLTETATSGNYTNVVAYSGNLVAELLAHDSFYPQAIKTSGANTSILSSHYSDAWSTGVMDAASTVVNGPIKGLSTQYLSFSNSRNLYATTVSSSILSDASTDASTGVTAAQSLSGTTEIQLDQFEQVENMYNNIRSQIQQSIAQRNLLVIKNSGSSG